MNKTFNNINEALGELEGLINEANGRDVMVWLVLTATYSKLYCIKLRGMK